MLPYDDRREVALAYVIVFKQIDRPRNGFYGLVHDILSAMGH